VSLVLRSYNRPPRSSVERGPWYLERALASVRTQCRGTAKVIVVNNRSEASEEIEDR